MKIARFFAAVAMVTATVICVSSQTKPAATPAAPPATAPQTVAVPDSKMAMIYSDAFLDPKSGIARFNSLLGTLNREFQPRQSELQGLQTRINTLAKETDDQSAGAAPSLRQKREQLGQMNTDFKRKGEDAEAAYTRRRQEIFTPLQQDIGKALEAFAKAGGITVFLVVWQCAG